MPKQNFSFYTASKIWHAPKHVELRDVIGLPVKARWIDLDETKDADYIKNHKDLLWQTCLEDVRDSDFLLLYSEDWKEEQRGALVEVGMALAFGKPIYAVGECKTVSPCPESDVAFTHHAQWNWLESKDLIEGAFEAINLFQQSQTETKVGKAA